MIAGFFCDVAMATSMERRRAGLRRQRVEAAAGGTEPGGARLLHSVQSEGAGREGLGPGKPGTGAASGPGGPHPHLLVVAGKKGKLYLLDRDKLGKFQEGANSQIVQSVKRVKDAYGAAAYWNRHIFFTDRGDVTRDFTIENGLLVAKGMTAQMPSPAATPIVSADGTKDAILWVVSTKEWNEAHMDRPAVLHAYDARDITHELYNSEQKSERDRAGITIRFAYRRLRTVIYLSVLAADWMSMACSTQAVALRIVEMRPPVSPNLYN
jgi:hypothetical protein